MPTIKPFAIVPLWACLLLCGCGRSSVPLGQVDGTLQLDGQPFGQVMVTFIPDDPHQPQSIGITDAEGKFRLRCGQEGTGAIIGTHRVTLVDAAVAPGAPEGRRSRDDDPPPEGTPAPVSRVPEIYSRADKTPLRQPVVSGSQSVTLNIPLGKKPG
jgi:hypothetical protein